jgi:putative salt-induced outer membrane protein YdiY
MRFLLVLSVSLCCLSPAIAQDEEEKKLGWSNVTNLSFVVTSGNSATSTLALDEKLTYAWSNADFNFRAGALRIQTTDDPFAVGTADDFNVVEDSMRELDTERYYLNGNYQRDISERFFWTGGAGWDRDTNAGIENRTVLFAGVGNTWKNTEQTRFKTDYTVTFTRRVDEIPDPERDEKFSELRLSWDLRQQLSSHSSVDSAFIFFARVSDFSDNRFVTVNGITTKLNEIIALRFSVDLRYQHIPAFEEIDLETPEGLPIGEVVVRKKKLDTIVKFSFVVTL